MNDKVKEILETITIGEPAEALKFDLLHFDGETDTFVVYSPTNERVDLAGDDIPIGEVESFDIDIYSKGNYLALSNDIKQAFITAGWAYKGRGLDTYDEPTKLYHRLLEFEKEVVA